MDDNVGSAGIENTVGTSWAGKVFGARSMDLADRYGCRVLAANLRLCLSVRRHHTFPRPQLPLGPDAGRHVADGIPRLSKAAFSGHRTYPAVALVTAIISRSTT